MTRSGSRLVDVAALVFGVVMIGSGATKLAGETHQVAMFSLLGLPAWFMALVGTFEVLGGILMIAPATRPGGSLILATIMVGALWAHAAQREWTHMAPVAMLLALFLGIFWNNRARAVRLLGGPEASARARAFSSFTPLERAASDSRA